jgi:hypothetical protein
VAAALELLQDHAAFTRRGHGGPIQASTSGYLGALFVHRTSRTGDPQLRSHVLVANKVRAVTDGRRLAVDGREIYEVQKAAGMFYEAALRAELSARRSGSPVSPLTTWCKRASTLVRPGGSRTEYSRARTCRPLRRGAPTQVSHPPPHWGPNSKPSKEIPPMGRRRLLLEPPSQPPWQMSEASLRLPAWVSPPSCSSRTSTRALSRLTGQFR